VSAYFCAKTQTNMNRADMLRQMADTHYDVCIIGGGASGAGCALDAALRGLRVLLIERDDFAAATSSRSTKLIHGGVRYLEQAFKNLDFGQLKQVRHGLAERHAVLANAPHLARPLALVTPVGSWFEGLYFRIGLWLYDRFASRNDTLPGSRWLSRREALALIPNLHPKTHSAVQYYDGQLDDARYALALVQSAAEAGATVVNHAQLIGFEHDSEGRLLAAHVCDLLSDVEILARASVFLNCTGPYADHVRILANPQQTPRIRPAKGVHAILPESALGGSKAALLIPKTPDGRVVFAIPFEGKTLLGTTDTPYDTLEDEPILTAEETAFLLETLQPYIAHPVTADQVQAGFGGLRPLIAMAGAAGSNTKTLLRDHEVEVDHHSGLLSLLGGKWTTYRIMARDAVDAVCSKLGSKAQCQTENHRLVGGANFNAQKWLQEAQQMGVATDIARHLADNYGDRAARVLALAPEVPDGMARLHADYPYIRAEVTYAARYEMCCTIRDFVARRIRLEFIDWAAAIEVTEQVGQLLASELGWDPITQQQNIENYRKLIEKFIASKAV
jgi:glycerol-3-phosphate dehydrogenase